MPHNPLAIYLHVPFCSTKCTYCAFNTYTHLENLIEPFVSALVREIEIIAASQPNQPAGTIFFGGGTPSLLTPEQFERILAALRDGFRVAADAEITLEANPNDLNRDYLAALRRVGLNRISIGMQTANANELELFKRRHDNDAVARAVSAARAAGFDNLNLDLIYGFPHQTLASWETSLRQMLALQPDHVSLYALGLEDGTPMKAWVERGRLPEPDDDLAADMYELASDLLGAQGYEQYEISNWARPGHQCRHNLQYWHNDPYVGVGPGAHGWAGGVRYSTVLSPQRYIRLLGEAEGAYPFPRTPATAEAVTVDRAGEISETLIMGMRLTREGISRPGFVERFGVDLLDVHGEVIQRYTDRGLLSVDAERVRLTDAGRLLSNVVFREFV
ncbi:MAG: radical SAM family heme chaperone HemW [Anaerolineae bacterium]|nr:radical SAM family heme chaperone HemW [Anaerolineae bacterium]